MHRRSPSSESASCKSETYKRAVVWWALRKARETKVGAEAQLSEFSRLLAVMGVKS